MSPPKRRAEGSAQGPAWPPLLWLAAMLGLVCIAVIETSAAPAGFWRLISGSGEPAPLAPVIIAGAALLVQPLLALDRRFGLLSIWLVRSDVSPVKRAPVLDAALTLACLAAVLLMLSLALGQPPQDFPRLSHFSSPVDIALFDGFHEGEVLGGFPIAVDHAPLPLLIHGPGKNLLPGALAAHFAEPGYGIAFMRLIEGAGRMLTVLMVAAAAATASASLLPAALPRSQRLILAAAPGLVATLGVLTFALPTNRQILLLAGLAVGVAMVSRAGRADGAPSGPHSRWEPSLGSRRFISTAPRSSWCWSLWRLALRRPCGISGRRRASLRQGSPALQWLPEPCSCWAVHRCICAPARTFSTGLAKAGASGRFRQQSRKW